MKLKSRHCLCAALLLSCLFVATGKSQYVEDSIDVGGAWVGSLAYNPEQDEIWGATWSGNCVFAISCSSNKVVASVPLSWAGSLAYDSTDGKLYCAYYGPDQESLAVISGATHQVIKRLEMPGSTMPVWDPVSDRVYVSCQTVGKVAVLDARTDSLLCYIAVDAYPIKMHMNTLRRKLYVQNSDAGTISVINLLTNQVVKTVVVGDIPNAGYYARAVDRYYCGGENDKLVVLDGRWDSIVAKLPVAPHSEIHSVSGNPVRDVVLASVYGGGSRLYAIDAKANKVDTVLQVGDGTYDILWSQRSDRFFCTSAYADEVVVLSGDGRQHLGSLPVGDNPFVLQAVPRHHRIYVGHLNSSKVYVIRDADVPWPEGQPQRPDTASGLRLGPSPFRDRLSVVCGTGVTAREVRIFGEDGRLMRVLNTTKSASGVLRSSWNGKDSRGRSVPAGVYFVEAVGDNARAKVVKQ
jgi:YVTN family beta-propeller protein